METINSAINAVMIVTTVGITFRILYCLFLVKCNPDDAQVYQKRVKNMMLFLVLCLCIGSIKELILKYYGG